MARTKKVTVEVPQEQQQIPRKAAYNVEEAALLLSVSRSFLYELLKDRKLIAKKIGDRVVVPHDELDRFLGTCPEAYPATV